MALTTRGLAAIKPGKWLSDEGRKGAGRLVAYGMKSGGAAFFFRYTRPDGKRDALPIGHFDPKGTNGLTLQQASDRAGELSRRFQAGDRDLRGAIEADSREAERVRRAAEILSAAEAAKAAATLGALLTGYVAQLTSEGKTSARAVESAVHRHVKVPWPALWGTPAADVTLDDLLSVVARVAADGKRREAAKLRSYLRAAYAAAISARQSPDGSSELRALKISHNPARDIMTIKGSSRSRDRALSLSELRAYWTRISSLPGAPGALLRFHVLTGGQRIKQVARCTMADVDVDSASLRMRDSKGRRDIARIHDVPLIPAALEAMNEMGSGKLGDFVFTLTGGSTPATYESMRDHLVEVRSEMEKAGELEKGAFTVGDLRRTIETRLAAAGVSREDRGQLQSHGLGGVQARHYDRHDYLAEKRAALERLAELLIDN